MKNSSNNIKTKKLSLIVGITTCYGGISILDTVRSIRASRGVDNFRFIIVADRVPIKPKIKRDLKRYDVELVESKGEGSQFEKQKQIIKMAKSDIIVFTQDDVLFEPKALATIVKRFEDQPKTTLVSILEKPLKATSLFEDIISTGTNMQNRIIKLWNNGDNFLSITGRCMVFRTKWIKGFKLPNEVVSTDAYRYFENKKHGGVFYYLGEVAVLFKRPQNMTEHLRKSSRFQHQKLEMSKYFGNLDKEYQIPKWIVAKIIIGEFLVNPVKILLYFGVYLYTRLRKISPEKALNANWEVDVSTKKVIQNNN